MKSKIETTIKASGKKAVAIVGAPVPSALQVAPIRVLTAPPATPEPKTPKQTKPIKIRSAAGTPKPSPFTTVSAKIDVGYGNTLFIRGQGDGLSWDKGLPLDCVDAATWVWATKKATGPIEFKLLLNDEIWAQGDNQTVAPGGSIETAPAFN